MPAYYVLAYPATACSLIQSGCLPAATASSAEVGPVAIRCYENYVDCVATTPTNLHQTFLLHVAMDPARDLPTVMEVACIEPASLQRVYVYSERGRKTLSNLLKGKLVPSIIVAPQLYPMSAETKSEANKPPPDALPSAALAPPSPSLGKVRIITGDILRSEMQTLVNTVNCVGVMGKGIALGFKQKYPDMFKDYKKKCHDKLVHLGEPYLYELADGRQVINFPTKNHWREDSKLENVENGLVYLSRHLNTWGVKSLAVPPLGCTNGNLDWADVFPLIQKHLYPLGIPLEIYTPSQAIVKKNTRGARSAFFRSTTSRENKEKNAYKRVVSDKPQDKKSLDPVPNYAATTTTTVASSYSPPFVAASALSSASAFAELEVSKFAKPRSSAASSLSVACKRKRTDSDVSDRGPPSFSKNVPKSHVT